MLKKIVIWLAHSNASENLHRRRRTMAIFLMFLLPLLILSSVTYVRTYRTLTDLSLSRRQSVAIPLALALKEKINKLQVTGQALAINPQIKAAINSGDWKKAIGILQIFQSILQEPFVDRIFLTDTKGTLMAGFPEQGAEGQNFAFQDWYLGIMETGKPYLSEAYKRSVQPQYNVVALAIPIVDDQNLLQAILVLQIRLDNFSNWVKDIETVIPSIVYIIDQAGQVVAHPDIDPQGAIANFSEVSAVANLLRGKAGLDTEYNPKTGLTEIAAYEPIPNYKWGLVLAEPVNDAFSARNKEIALFIAFHIFIVLLYSFMLFLLLHAAEHYSGHDFDE